MSPEPRFDHDNPEWTEADFARAKPLSAGGAQCGMS